MHSRQIVIALGTLFAATASAQQSAPPTLKLTQEVRIDGATEDLSSVGSVIIGPDGRVVFFEPQDARVRIYSAAGREIGRFGRRGEGPGEFGFGEVVPLNLSGRGGPSGPQVRLGMIGDTIWALNSRRFTLISKDGHLVRTVSQPTALSERGGAAAAASDARKLMSFDPQALLSGSNTLGLARWMGAAGARATGAAGIQAEYGVASSSGDITKTLARVPYLSNFVSVSGGGAAVPFLEGIYQSVSPDGSRIAIGTTTIASARTGTLHVIVMSSAGDTLLSRDYPFTPIPISASTADSAINDRMRSMQTSPNKGELESKVRAAMPKAASPYRALQLGADGSIWIRGPRRADGQDYLVLDERGNTIGALSVPANTSIGQSATRSMVWAVVTDANDVPSLVRYRVAR